MRQFSWALLFIIFVTLQINAFPQATNSNIVKINPYLKVIEIDKDVYRVIHKFPWSANSLLVRITDTEFVLADTPIENTGSRALVEWMREKFGDVNLTIINCHFHIDCLGGNHYMLSQGFPVYASDMTLQLFEENRLDMGRKALRGLTDHVMIEAFTDYQTAPPDHIFKAEEGLILHIGGEEIELYYPGPAHTEDNIVVYFPKRKILFGGCMVKAMKQNNLGNLADANVEEWPASVQKLLEKYPDAEIVVPGHGAHGSFEMIKHTLDLLKNR